MATQGIGPECFEGTSSGKTLWFKGLADAFMKIFATRGLFPLGK